MHVEKRWPKIKIGYSKVYHSVILNTITKFDLLTILNTIGQVSKKQISVLTTVFRPAILVGPAPTHCVCHEPQATDTIQLCHFASASICSSLGKKAKLRHIDVRLSTTGTPENIENKVRGKNVCTGVQAKTCNPFLDMLDMYMYTGYNLLKENALILVLGISSKWYMLSKHAMPFCT